MNSWEKYLHKIAYFVHRQMAADQNYLAKEGKLDITRYFDGPGDMHSIYAANNTSPIEYSYISSSIRDRKTMDFYMKAYPCHLKFEQNTNPKELLKFLSWTMKNTKWPEEFYKGPGHSKPLCRKPNTDKIPDIVLYMHRTEAPLYGIPMFICEIIRSKKIWGTVKMQYPGYVSTLSVLAFFLVVYYLEVRYIEARMYRFSCNPQKSRIDITSTLFDFKQQMPQAFCNVFMQMTKAILKALSKMYCYTQCAHLAVHDYLVKGKPSSTFRETGQDTTICKECFHFQNYDSLMSLLEQTDKFAVDTSPAISIIAEGDEDSEDEPSPGDDIPPKWDTWDQQKKQEFFLRVQKGKAVQPKKGSTKCTSLNSMKESNAERKIWHQCQQKLF